MGSLSPSDAEPRESPPDVAYYYPAPFWGPEESGWVKSLLLFFDQVAILLPRYMDGMHAVADASLVEPLEDAGLLRVLEPESFVDQQVTEDLATVLTDLMAEGAFADLPEAPYFQELSQSRIGDSADVDLGEMLVDELMALGLARDSEDGVLVLLHPTVRTTILVLLSQLARGAGNRRGLRLHPTTSEAGAIDDLVTTLRLSPLPSAGQVVQLDLQQVSFDLDPVPLDEVLAFRAEHQASHRAYMVRLQGVVAEMGDVAGEERERLMLERQGELAETAAELQRQARRSFRVRLAGWSLAIAGAAWGVSTRDPIGLVLDAAGLALERSGHAGPQVSAYSYLFDLQTRLSA